MVIKYVQLDVILRKSINLRFIFMDLHINNNNVSHNKIMKFDKYYVPTYCDLEYCEVWQRILK